MREPKLNNRRDTSKQNIHTFPCSFTSNIEVEVKYEVDGVGTLLLINLLAIDPKNRVCNTFIFANIIPSNLSSSEIYTIVLCVDKAKES
ncbi:hypothetical protein CR513_51395, partial [Mucuna pruriens]